MVCWAIAVHAGAGYHSPAFEAAYKRDLTAACRAGAAVLTAGGDALAAVTAAIKVLEDSSHCNAGRGSNLSYTGAVECDASVMTGDGTFGSVAAAPGIHNPIEAAALLARESRQPLSNGRVRPMMLAGDRAREWALSRGLPAAATSAEAATMHVTEPAQRQWAKYRRIVDGRSATVAGSSAGGKAASAAGGSTPACGHQPGAAALGQEQATCDAQPPPPPQQQHEEQQYEQQRPSKKSKHASPASKVPESQHLQQQQQQQQRRRWWRRDGQQAVPSAALAPASAAAASAAASTQAQEQEQQALSEDAASCFYDTVGCVVLAPGGAVAAGVSSGGIVLKTEGRVGEAAVYGAGCWAQQQQEGQPGQQQQRQPSQQQQQQQQYQAVACSVTGVGEHVMRHLLARELCREAAAPQPSPMPLLPPSSQVQLAGAAAARAPAGAPAAATASVAAGNEEEEAEEEAGGPEAEVPLAQVAAQLLQQTILQGPAPHDCGLLCLRAQMLERREDGEGGRQGSLPQELVDGAEERGCSSGTQLLLQQQHPAARPADGSSGLSQPAAAGLSGDADARSSRQKRRQKYGVELAVAHTAQSMAFGHMSCAGSGCGGRSKAAGGAAAPAVHILRRQAGCNGQGPPAVQTYMHGLTVHV